MLYLRGAILIVMKKTQIILLLLVLAGIIGMSFFIKDLTTQETFGSAAKKGKFVVVKAKLDKQTPIQYDAVKNPNLTVFYAVDKDGQRTRVVYNQAKITDMERSESLDLNGFMRDGYFECNRIQTKCPSKYKDDPKQQEKNLTSTNETK